MLRLSGIRYDAGSWLTTTRSQATPPHDQRRSACASERSRPRPWRDAGRDEDDRPVARDAEAPEQAPVADVARFRRRAGACATSESESAVESVWIAAKFSALMRISRRRMPVSVADISEARSMLPSWRYLSITARSVAGSSAAAVQKVRRTFALGAICMRTANAATGSRPVSSVAPSLPSGARRQLVEDGERMARVAVAAEPALAIDLDPDRDVRRLGLGEEVGRDAGPCRSTRRGFLAKTIAWWCACHSALTNRFENAGCDSSARGSASVTSNDDISSRSSVRSPQLCRTTRRNSMSSSGLTQTVVVASSSGQVALKATRSACRLQW